MLCLHIHYPYQGSHSIITRSSNVDGEKGCSKLDDYDLFVMHRYTGKTDHKSLTLGGTPPVKD